MKNNMIFHLIVLMIFLLSLTGCEFEKKAQVTRPQSQQVEIAFVKPELFTQSIELPGRISPVRVAQVRARVAGILLSRNFVEGSDVTKGQVLFHIDPVQYEASLAEAKAELAKAEVILNDSMLTEKRYLSLLKSNSVSRQKYDKATADFKVAMAVKRAAQAKVKIAELKLSYATVVAPISGRIGRAQVTEGALVGQGEATHLATIQQLDPIYADLTESLSDYLKLKSFIKNKNSTKSPVVTVELDEIEHNQQGHLIFSDVTVDQKTEQVSLRSEFSNPGGMLLPGMFVRIKINLETNEKAILIPQRAVQLGQDGSAQVYVIDSKGIAQRRVIKTGPMEGARWQVLDGLKAGERIVVNGIEKIRPGMSLVNSVNSDLVAQE